MSKKFDKLTQHIQSEYEKKGMTSDEAKKIAEATAGKIAREKDK